MPRHSSGNAAQMPMKETGTGSHPKGPDTSLTPSDEGRFWSRLDELEAKGISRSRCTRLLKLTGHDFGEIHRILDSVEAAKKPAQYLGVVIRNREQSAEIATRGANPHVPAWVAEKRVAGIPVERQGALWLCQGRLWTDAGEEVG